MEKLIITTPQELKSILEEVLQENRDLSKMKKNEDAIDTLSLEGTIEFLNELGYTTSKAKIYKLTAANKIPYGKYGSKLIFSRKSLIEWTKRNTVDVTDTSDSIIAVVKSANRSNS